MHIMRTKNDIKIIRSEILAEMIFGWPTFKNDYDTQPPSSIQNGWH